MTSLFNRWLPGFTLLAWSAVLLSFYITGRISSFLIPAFRTNVLLAGLVFLAMACFFLFLPAVANCCDEERCGHPLGRRKLGRIVTFLVLLLPVVTAAFCSPKNFGASTILNKGINTDGQGLIVRGRPLKMPIAQAAPQAATTQNAATADNPAEPPLPTKNGSQPAATPAPQAATSQTAADNYLPKSKDGNIEVQVIDLLYAAQDSSMRADFDGKTVETIGQLMPDDTNNAAGNRFKLMRMFMYCCAADAKPIATLVESPPQTGALPQEMSWVRVVGKVSFPIEGGRTIPVLKALSVKQAPPPEETMLY
jgi:uncharacterized repeat protein (TIGR03943 family)